MMRNPEEVWSACLDTFRDVVDGQSYETWFTPITAVSLEQDGAFTKLTVRLPSPFFYEWLESHYPDLIRKTVQRVLGPDGRLVYDVVIEQGDRASGSAASGMRLPARPASDPLPTHVNPELGHVRDFEAEAQLPPLRYPGLDSRDDLLVPRAAPPAVFSNLNASYVFDRFVEGDCNRLARSAAMAIAQQPGKTSFNPFMIYGGVGLGKTHLIQAIGNYALANAKAARILYVSSERFTTEFVQAIQHNRVSDFTVYYQSVDLLIIDDAQFFAGKEKTQEEFFHIFNALHQSGKQIVLSADRPPRDIDGIEERLLSRFQWGLSADMQAPDLETRIAILRRKAEDDGISIDQDVVEFIAHNIKSNIRELEGALIRLLAFSTLNKREIDLPMAKEVLRDLVKDTRINLTIDELQNVVSDYFNVSVDLVCSKTRKREVVRARQVAMYFCKELTPNSLKTIGLHFGGRDHSTVIHANQSVHDQIETDPMFRDMISELRHKIELRSR
ncbi:MAG: chromosomal replication initiator protein DnaA [Rhodothermales bacterium]|nr:chromosomal replication initiator protein DnaA [Rhodothermales bacterium]